MARRKRTGRRRRGSFRFLYKLLSIVLICAVIIVAVTMFFRVENVEVTGQERYEAQQIRDASGIQTGKNLFLLNKYDVAAGIIQNLPYIEQVRINRKLPDTLVIEVKECAKPLMLEQDGSIWLISSKGKIVDKLQDTAGTSYAVISGCELLAPTVGTQIALPAEYLAKQESLLSLMGELEKSGMMQYVDELYLEDKSALVMDYAGRFTVKMPYEADYAMKLKALTLALQSGKIQENMTGTFDMVTDEDDIYFKQNIR